MKEGWMMKDDDFKLLRGFADGWTFVIVESHSRLQRNQMLYDCSQLCKVTIQCRRCFRVGSIGYESKIHHWVAPIKLSIFLLAKVNWIYEANVAVLQTNKVWPRKSKSDWLQWITLTWPGHPGLHQPIITLTKHFLSGSSYFKILRAIVYKVHSYW